MPVSVVYAMEKKVALMNIILLDSSLHEESGLSAKLHAHLQLSVPPLVGFRDLSLMVHRLRMQLRESLRPNYGSIQETGSSIHGFVCDVVPWCLELCLCECRCKEGGG